MYWRYVGLFPDYFLVAGLGKFIFTKLANFSVDFVIWKQYITCQRVWVSPATALPHSAQGGFN